jgi:hypothetical protein
MDPEVEAVRAALYLEWGYARHLEWHSKGVRRLSPFG